LTSRYSRQIIFPGIGEAGQAKLAQSYAVIVGLGALGTVIATSLVRAGVGRVRVIDRDFIEYHNLQRQLLFTEADVAAGLPKAIAGEKHLREINSEILVEGIVADLNPTNAETLTRGADVILDGLDNFETRLLLNDAALKQGIPWVYGGAVGSHGMTLNVIPGQPPCFRCLFGANEYRGTVATCDTAGVVNPATLTIGALEAAEALKILVGHGELRRDILFVDVWANTFDHLAVKPREDCPACHGSYELLDAKPDEQMVILCGQNAVQITRPGLKGTSFRELKTHLEPVAAVSFNEHLLTFTADGHEVAVFPDGRAIVKNTVDLAEARSIYAKYIGS
jgi:molybdopterin-synthase adenylyltransferase